MSQTKTKTHGKVYHRYSIYPFCYRIIKHGKACN